MQNRIQSGKTQQIIKRIMGSSPDQKAALPQFIVDPDSGPYKTIQEAVDIAVPGSIIKIAPGLYGDPTVIDKPDLILMPKDKNGHIIIQIQKGPGILIKLKPDETCKISGIKMSHSGNSEDIEKLEKQIQGKKFAASLFENENIYQADDAPKISPVNEFINTYNLDEENNCLIMVLGGKVEVEDCLLSLNFIVNNFKDVLPAVVAANGSDLTLNKVEIKGFKTHETIGVIIIKSDAIIKECKIHLHQLGGIHVWANKKNKVKILNSKIVFNSKVGIHIIGQNSNCLIQGNKIENNPGSGVRIGIANKSSIIRNEIKMNQFGIEVISADPFIFSNKIDRNFEHGIYTYTYQDLRCDGRIKTNLSISGNEENGILCCGKNNHTRIEQNSFIGFNKRAGIKGDDDARIYMIVNEQNLIKNFKGILLVETSSAVIEKNEISDNIKANIALGGQNSVNTLIVENRINGGRCEGIFVVEGGQCWINRNNIQENNDGIVISKSVPEINRNSIIRNKSNGIIVLNYSNPRIIDNLITDNDGIGLFIREFCTGTYKKNFIKGNEIEMVIQRRSKYLENILKDNSVTGDIRIPQNSICNIF